MTTLGIILTLILILLWNMDFIASLLNIKAGSSPFPSEFSDTYDVQKYKKSQDYTRATEKFSIVESIISLMMLLAFWFSGGFGFLDEALRSLGQNDLITGILYILCLLFAQWILAIPVSIYKTFVIEEKFGFNKTNAKTFMVDQIKGVFIGGLIGIPILALILWIFGTVSMAWLWAWLAFTAIQLVLTYFAPSLLLPLFNKFEPMPEGELKESVEAMSKKCNFPLTELFIMDGSKRSTKSNAFFTGFGKNKKIALFDTLVENHSTEGLVAVLAHEIGHFKLKHIVKMMVQGVIQTAVIFFLLGVITDDSYSFNGMIYETFLIENASVYTGLVIFMILFAPISKILSFLGNRTSRKHEFEADAYAANAQGTSEHLINALKKLSADNLSNLTPHPFTVSLDYSHPPTLQRIQALRDLKLN